MKGLEQFITEASGTTALVNKIKKEFEKEFGKTVTIGSGKANYQQLYDVYIYDDKLETLQKVNDILKKHLPIWKGFTDDEMKQKLQEHLDFLKKHKDDKWMTLDRFPIEFFRFTSRDLRKIIGEGKEDIRKEQFSPEKVEEIFKFTKTDTSKPFYILFRNIPKKTFTIVKFDDVEKAKKLMSDVPQDLYHYQMMCNEKEYLLGLTKLITFKKDGYKVIDKSNEIYESCGGKTEHKIVQDAAGNWRIKGTPGKGTNTDKEGLWAAKYNSEEDAKKALAAYHANKA